MKNLGRSFPFFHYTNNSLVLLFFAFTLVFFIGCGNGNVKEDSAVKMEMVKIKGGTFMMGSPQIEPGREINGNDETQHSVTVSTFSMGKYPVTQSQYEAVMGKNPSRFTAANEYPQRAGETAAERRPVESVSWYDAIVFCNKLSIREGLKPVYIISESTDPSKWPDEPITLNDSSWNAVSMVSGANGYRLPTEAEWEYACRGDYPDKATETATKPFGLGDGTKMTHEMANFNTYYQYDILRNPAGQYNDKTGAGYLGQTIAVEKYSANNYGLYDMHGNVLEWCWDWYGTFSAETQTDPIGAASGANRVLRGGSWGNDAQNLRSACRASANPGYWHFQIGFRVVRN